MSFKDTVSNVRNRVSNAYNKVSDFLDTSDGKFASTAANLLGVVGFLMASHTNYEAGATGAGLYFSIISAACAFNAGRCGHQYHLLSKAENQKETQETPEETVAPE